MMKSFAFIVGLFAASASAQQATASQYGFGCGPTHAPFASVLSYTGVPRLGTTFSVHFDAPTYGSGRTTTFGRLFTGFSNRSWAGASLPIWVAGSGISGPVGALHCMVWSSWEIDMGLAAGSYQGRMDITVPMQPSLVGLQLYQQWYLIQLLNSGGSTTEMWYWTNGGALTVGT